MYRRDLLSISDLEPDDVERIFRAAVDIKAEPRDYVKSFAGKVMVMIFQKPSLRTRVTFEAGFSAMGGHAIFMSDQETSVGAREPVRDVARNLERWVDLIVARVFGHDTVTDLAGYAKIPVINALSDFEHPCQALADLFTLSEHWHGFNNRHLVYVGDGNNVCHSLLLLCGLTGLRMTVACPQGYEPDEKVVKEARASFGDDTGIVITTDPAKAVQGADAIYTDVWASMGQEAEAKERAKIFAPYEVNADLVGRMKPDALVMHCLPAHRGEEITDDVLESANSVVFDQAENRLHVQKAVMRLLLVP